MFKVVVISCFIHAVAGARRSLKRRVAGRLSHQARWDDWDNTAHSPVRLFFADSTLTELTKKKTRVAKCKCVSVCNMKYPL